MLQNILDCDLAIFNFINQGLSNPATDFIMPIITQFLFWLPLFVVFLVYQFWKGGIKGKILIITLVLGVIICDQLTSNIIKEIVGRSRPCHTLLDINLLVGCGSGKSFPSSHASNAAMAISIIILFFRRCRYWLWIIPFVIGVSRVFVGVHYPFDILCGWILGIIVGIAVYYLVKWIFNRQSFIAKFNKKNVEIW